MKKTLSILLSFIIIISSLCISGTSFAADSTVTVKYCQTDARKMLEKVNSFRTGKNAWYWNEDNSKKIKCKNLSNLTYDYALEKVAMLRAAELVKNYSHIRPNGESCFTAYAEKGYTGFNGCAENIAWVVSSDPFTLWKEENESYAGQGHRRTMLDKDFKAIGIAGVYYNGKYYWVQEFSDKVVSKKKTTANNSKTKVKIKGSKTTDKKKAGSKTIVLSKTSYTYDGKVKKPIVTVKDGNGNTLAKTNYTVTYPKGRKNVGKYTITVKFKGFYSGTLKKTFTIKPKSTTISKLTAGKKAFTVKWKKQATQTTGYQIQYATDSKFTKNKKTATVSKNKSTSKKISKLSSKKKYYVRVRTYKTVKVNGKNTKIYSSWSKTKTVTTK